MEITIVQLFIVHWIILPSSNGVIGISVSDLNSEEHSWGKSTQRPSTNISLQDTATANETVSAVDWDAVYEAKRIASMIAVVGFVPCVVLILFCNSIIPKDCGKPKA